jgi:hypothetical protein
VASSSPVLAGQVEVGHAYEAEFFAGVYFGIKHGYARQAGWEAVEDPSYLRGEAATALRTGVMATHPLTDPPGDYCLSLVVFDSGTGETQSLDVRAGGTTTSQTWSGASAGMRDIEVAIHVGSARQLAYWVPAHAPIGTIVDRITLYPPASSGTCGPTPST